MSRRVSLCRELKAVEGRRRSEGESEQGVQWHGLDPKPGELSMARLKDA